MVALSLFGYVKWRLGCFISFCSVISTCFVVTACKFAKFKCWFVCL